MIKRWYAVSGFVVLALALSLGAAHPAFAQSGGTVVVGGLNNPRGVAVGADGSIYVAEAGNGGPNVLGTGDTAVHWGYSGQVTKIAPDGTRSVAARNLLSGGGGDGFTGPAGLIAAGGALWAVIGAASDNGTKNPGENTLLRIDPSTGMTQTVANIGAYELAHNPGGFAIDTDAYGLTLGPDGNVYVADAAGNDVLKVNPSTGDISLLAVIPGIAIPAAQAPPGGNPARGGANELDPVPTGLAFGPDGALYVSLLSGGPFPTGAAKVVRVTMDGKVSDAVGGLTMATDIKLGPDGNWYVVEFARFDLQAKPPTFTPNSGDVVRIMPSGQRQVVAGGLNFPNKIAFDPSGNLYVSVLSVSPTGGQLLRFANVAAAAGGTAPGMPTTGSPAPIPWPVLLSAVLLLTFGLALRRRSFAQPRPGR